jgi:hypothetical protein
MVIWFLDQQAEASDAIWRVSKFFTHRPVMAASYALSRCLRMESDKTLSLP